MKRKGLKIVRSTTVYFATLGKTYEHTTKVPGLLHPIKKGMFNTYND